MLLKLTVFFIVLAGLGGAFHEPLYDYWKQQMRPKYRVSRVSRGNIRFVVNSTGTIKPVKSVLVGSFVSGPIRELYVDFNTAVKKGDLLAKVDPRTFEAQVARDEAILATKQADVDRVEARLQQARNDEQRGFESSQKVGKEGNLGFCPRRAKIHSNLAGSRLETLTSLR